MMNVVILAIAGLIGAAPAPAHEPSAAAKAANPYAPYDWLIGDWSSTGGIRQQISYGPGQSYVRFSVFTPGPDGEQHLHFEGIALWNGKTKALDYLFAVEPGSGVQEKGTFRAEADGSIIREIELIDAKGKGGTFRQTFRKTGANAFVTSVMRQTDKGWEPTFPGSDSIGMTKRD